jgi:hypothetical protein
MMVSTADGNHRVDGDHAGLHRGVDRLAIHHTGGDAFDRAQRVAVDRTLAVDGLAQGVDDAADQGLTDRDRDDAAGGVDLIAFLDGEIVAQDDGADRVALEIQGETVDGFAAPGLDRELEQFGCHDLFEAADAGHAVTDGDNGTDIHHLGADVGTLLDTFEQTLVYVVCCYCHNLAPQSLCRDRCVATLSAAIP